MDEFVKGLCLTEHIHVLTVAMWYALEELVHVEVISQALLLSLAGSRVQIASVSVKERCKATHECGTHLIRAEGNRADDAYCGRTATMNSNATTCGLSVKRSGVLYQHDLPLHRKTSSSHLSSQMLQVTLRSPCRRCRQCPSTHFVVALSLTCCTIAGCMIVLAANVLCA